MDPAEAQLLTTTTTTATTTTQPAPSLACKVNPKLETRALPPNGPRAEMKPSAVVGMVRVEGLGFRV